MSSITVGELISHLNHYSKDYEVIMHWRWKENGEKKESIAMINGIQPIHEYRELRLLN